MLVEVSGPCGTAKSDTLRPKRLPIHIGSAGERARPPVLNFFVPDQMNRTEPNRLSLGRARHINNNDEIIAYTRYKVTQERGIMRLEDNLWTIDVDVECM
jgi:hypothetical protein